MVIQPQEHVEWSLALKQNLGNNYTRILPEKMERTVKYVPVREYLVPSQQMP